MRKTKHGNNPKKREKIYSIDWGKSSDKNIIITWSVDK